MSKHHIMKAHKPMRSWSDVLRIWTHALKCDISLSVMSPNWTTQPSSTCVELGLTGSWPAARTMAWYWITVALISYTCRAVWVKKADTEADLWNFSLLSVMFLQVNKYIWISTDATGGCPTFLYRPVVLRLWWMNLYEKMEKWKGRRKNERKGQERGEIKRKKIRKKVAEDLVTNWIKLYQTSQSSPANCFCGTENLRLQLTQTCFFFFFFEFSTRMRTMSAHLLWSSFISCVNISKYSSCGSGSSVSFWEIFLKELIVTQLVKVSQAVSSLELLRILHNYCIPLKISLLHFLH